MKPASPPRDAMGAAAAVVAALVLGVAGGNSGPWRRPPTVSARETKRAKNDTVDCRCGTCEFSCDTDSSTWYDKKPKKDCAFARVFSSSQARVYEACR